GEEKVVKIEKGWGSIEVAQKLRDEQIIKSKWFFVFYSWIRGYNNRLQAGEYLLSPKITIFEIAKIIANGEINPNWVKITIPEGWTNKQIEVRLKENGVIGQDEKLSENSQGYLFPDTYYFYKSLGIEEVIKKMRDNFDKKVGKDTSYDILKMASILEKEVISDEDRAIVSGIFWERIKNNYPLESCATIAYILGIDKWRYSYQDTRIKSPYNTYINLGLPPTPINNPGLSAINAALNPKQTDYNFFLTDPDTGTSIYSKTLDEHNANKTKYLH
ncbi:MAG: endolytic transglycosylase MltG, partial [Patescibacteria group bacterium]